jgi:3-(3-hydroxy-phenyl)propionate hydroxylase
MKDGDRFFDVAIVGVGPVGAVAANLCGVHGLSTIAVDREKDVHDLPRAAAIHDDAQRILHNAGVLEAVLPSTCEMLGAEFVDAAGKRIIGIEVPPGAAHGERLPAAAQHQPAGSRTRHPLSSAALPRGRALHRVGGLRAAPRR